METAIVTFSNGKTGPEKVTVDLVSAIHIGDKEYYEELNKKFDSYDVVLYEQVIADDEIDERFEADLKQMGMISMFQKGMTNALNLVHQLEHIDYKKEHFVHADMKLSEFLERAQIRGDLQNLLMRANTLGNEEDQDMPIFEGKMVALLFSKDPSLSLKRLFAEYMDVMLPEIDKVFSGEDGSAIITDRNAVCLKRLEEQIKKGKNKIAIFYGSAHNPEFAVSLENDFNLKYDNKRVWVIAWDMTKDKSARK